MSIDENQFFREATLRICSSLEIRRALAEAYDYLRQVIPMNALLLLYYDPARAAAYAMASMSEQQGAQNGSEEPVFVMDTQSLERLRSEGASVNTEHPVRIRNRPTRDPIYESAARFLSLHGLPEFSLLMLRLDVQADYQGVLWMAAPGYDQYSSEHGRLARILADPFAIAMSNARRYHETMRLTRQLAEDNRAMYRELEGLSGDRVIGAEFGLRPVMGLVRQVAPMNAPVLLQGETGTGKEVIANAIHAASPRGSGPFVRVQCGAMPDSLLDSELFGHERGAFTGAVQAKRGRFERADGGTIFFDEVGELTLEAQVKLLRVLSDRTFERLGGSKTLSVDVRVIAATNRVLQQQVETGAFREDLWFRLNVFPIHLPPLRHRTEDIPALVQYFVDRKSKEMGLPVRPELAVGAMDQLLAYDWPGNVRELQNVIERSLILCRGRALEFPHLGTSETRPQSVGTSAVTPTRATLDDVIAGHIRRTMAETGGRVQGPGGAAELLGLNASTLRARMRRLGIPFGRGAGW